MTMNGIYRQSQPEFSATRSLINTLKEAIAENNIERLTCIIKGTKDIKNKCVSFVDQTLDGYRILINLDNMNILIDGGAYDLSSALLIITELYGLISLAESVVNTANYVNAIKKARIYGKNKMLRSISNGNYMYFNALRNEDEPIKNIFSILMAFKEGIQNRTLDKLISVGAVNIISQESLYCMVELTRYGKLYCDKIKKGGK